MNLIHFQHTHATLDTHIILSPLKLSEIVVEKGRIHVLHRVDQQRPLWFYISTLRAQSEVAAVAWRAHVTSRCVMPAASARPSVRSRRRHFATVHPRRCFCFRTNSRLNFRRRVLLQCEDASDITPANYPSLMWRKIPLTLIDINGYCKGIKLALIHTVQPPTAL